MPEPRPEPTSVRLQLGSFVCNFPRPRRQKVAWLREWHNLDPKTADYLVAVLAFQVIVHFIPEKHYFKRSSAIPNMGVVVTRASECLGMSIYSTHQQIERASESHG